MKRLFCVLLIGMMILSGCAEPEEKTAVCRIETEGMTEEMKLNALDDEVLSIKSVMKLPFSMYGITTEDEKAAFTEQMLAGFNVPGVSAVSNSTADEFVLELSIVLSEVTYQDLVTLGMMSEEDADSEMVSLQKTLEGLTSSGYTCE